MVIDVNVSSDIIVCGYLRKRRKDERLGKFLRNLRCTKRSSSAKTKAWQKRYCVLYKVRKQYETTIYFDYYKSGDLTKFKGRVDLEHCSCVIQNVEMGGLSNVFSLTTLHNGRGRVYFFMADNTDTMREWVHHLVTVAGLADMGVVDPNGTHTISTNSPPFINLTNTSKNPSIPIRRPSEQVRNNNLTINIAQRLTNDDTYRDPRESGVDYLSPELDDGYHALPTASHSYVNLANTVVENEADLDQLDYNTLTVDYKQTHFKSVNETFLQSKPPDKVKLTVRQNSHDSVYYNVWEAGVDKTNDQLNVQALENSESAINAQRRQNPAPPPNPHIHPCNGNPGDKADTGSTSLGEQKVSPCYLIAPRKPMALPREAFVENSMTSLHAPSGNNDTATIDASNDLALPVRASTSRNRADSSCSSSTSSSGASVSNHSSCLSVQSGDDQDRGKSVQVDNDNDENLNIALNDKNIHLNTSNCSLHKLGNNQTQHTGYHGAVEEKINHKIDNSQSFNIGRPGYHIKISQLNYIEPFNLDLRTQTLNTNLSPYYIPAKQCDTIKYIINANKSNIGNNNTNGSNLPNLNDRSILMHSPSGVTVNTLSSSINPFSTSNGPSASWNLSSVIQCKKDEKIEYREIDPISTNALAAVTRRYFFDDDDNNNGDDDTRLADISDNVPSVVTNNNTGRN